MAGLTAHLGATRLDYPAEQLLLWIGRCLEFLWLLTVVMVPLAFFGRHFGEWSSVIGSFELPKIALLRTAVALMTTLWLVELWLHSHTRQETAGRTLSRWMPSRRRLSEIAAWLRDRPERWLAVAVALFLGSTLLSTALSTSYEISVWGDIPGQDSYSAYTVISYVLLFGVIATHLKSRQQLWRLLAAIVAMGSLVAGYAISQHHGYDFLDLMEPPTGTRSTSTMSNAIFAGAVLLMTISVTLAAATVTLRREMRTSVFWVRVGIWVPLLAIQFLGITYTFSRGPWSGMLVAVVAFLIAVAAFSGWRALSRAAIVLVLAAALAAVAAYVPASLERNNVTGAGASASSSREATLSEVTRRFTSVGSAGGVGGLSGRLEIWKSSWDLAVDRPWFAFDNLSLSGLRPLIGYGPDLFRPTYLLVSPTQEGDLHIREAAHAHNFFVHQSVELGLLGLISSVGLFAAVILVGGFQLLRKSGNFSEFHVILLIGLLAAVSGLLM